MNGKTLGLQQAATDTQNNLRERLISLMKRRDNPWPGFAGIKITAMNPISVGSRVPNRNSY
ncbi:hypothetical protein ED312_15985 [Sinomicrobium pectinilyticum]|uniref:Uncharacterized protein n=1 Tax=Sinomicrobium pectinilyticum TaxID=1084421 RepID=A0A3N0E577_SINP1|nr:hypothetical protein ED312_15985 [Sinomicrobium pectinilyticum]